MALLKTLIFSLLLLNGFIATSYAKPKVPDGKSPDISKAVKVFILMGQDNMVGYGKIDLLKGIAPKKYPYLIKDGKWTTRKDVRNVRFSCSSKSKLLLNDWLTVSKGAGFGRYIGPEIAIGNYLGEAIEAPVLILKVCISRRHLAHELLPPSAPGYAGSKKPPRRMIPGAGWYAGIQYDIDVSNAMKVIKNIGTYYPGANKCEVAGFFFWHGYYDAKNNLHTEKYEKNLVHLIKDLRKDFNAAKAPFVCATMGQSRKEDADNNAKITNAQLAVDGKAGNYLEFKDNVATFYSHPVAKQKRADRKYDYDPEVFMNVGEGMGKAMLELLEKAK